MNENPKETSKKMQSLSLKIGNELVNSKLTNARILQVYGALIVTQYNYMAQPESIDEAVIDEACEIIKSAALSIIRKHRRRHNAPINATINGESNE